MAARARRPARPPWPPADVWALAQEAVESGVLWGWNRAHKHTDAPGDDRIKEAIADAVMSELSERFRWPE